MFSTHADTFLLGVKLHVKISGKFQHVLSNHLQVEEYLDVCICPQKTTPEISAITSAIKVMLETLRNTFI